MKKLLFIFFITLGLLSVLKIYIFPPRLTLLTSHIRQPDTYLYYTGYPKDLVKAIVRGHDCNALDGVFAVDAFRRGGARGDQFRWIGDWRQLLGGEPQRLEDWRNEKHEFSTKWRCVPYVSNISQYLENPDAELEWVSITPVKGPLLAAEGEKISDGQVKVEKIFACGKNEHVFCATASFSNKSHNYRIVCWDCDALKKDAQSLERSISSQIRHGVINHEQEFTLEGGHMVSEESFGAKQGGFPRGNVPQDSVFYDEKKVGEYAEKRWERVLSLLD